MTYLKLLETFVLTVLMDKTEYNFFHKNFRPVKLLVILMLSANVFFTFYLLSKLSHLHDVIVERCPSLFEVPPKALVPLKKKK